MMTLGRPRPLEAQHVDAILELVRQRAGLVFPPSRRNDAENGIRKTMDDVGIGDPESFGRQLEIDLAAFEILIGRLVVGETYFFREPQQFDLVRRRILPELLVQSGGVRRLRIWSAACATGEEPYSIAILAEQEGLTGSVLIQGTDISPASIRSARKATYGAWSLRGLTDQFIKHNFDVQDDRFALNKRHLGAVRFDQHNLRSNLIPKPLIGLDGVDLIFCRNVLIYFDPDSIRATARLLFDALTEGGWLITSPADPPLADHAPFETVMTPAGLVYRRNQRAIVGTTSPRSAIQGERRNLKPPVAARQRSTARPVPPTLNPMTGAAADDFLERIRIAFSAADFAVVLRMTEGQISNPAAQMLRIRALIASGDTKTAEIESAEAVGKNGLDPELHYLRGLLQIDLGRQDEAVESLRRAVYLDRTLIAAHFALGMTLRHRGAMESARRSFRNVASLCRDRPSNETVPLTDAESVGRLSAAAQTELDRIDRAVATADG